MKTLLKVVSIICIIIGALGLIGGIVLCFTADEIVNSIGYSDYSSYNSGATVSTQLESIDVVIIGVLAILGAFANLLSGIFGIIGCHGNKKILTAGLIITVIGLVVSIGVMIFSIATGRAIGASYIGYILPTLYLFSGSKVQKEL